MRLSTPEIRELLLPYLEQPAPEPLCDKIVRYLDLLRHWNNRVNLTAIREPVLVVQRHFGESFFLSRHLPNFQTLLDFGSGAGFPGLPIAMVHPRAHVTLGESHLKKAAFLREASWMVGSSASVWADRIEKLPANRTFNIVTLRAVDMMPQAIEAALSRLAPDGVLAFFAAKSETFQLPTASWLKVDSYPIPNNVGKIILAHRE